VSGGPLPDVVPDGARAMSALLALPLPSGPKHTPRPARKRARR